MPTPLTSLRKQGWKGQAAAVASLTVLVYVLVAPVAGLLHRTGGVLAAAAAAGLCLLGAVLALAVTHRFPDPKHLGQAFLVGMLPRMGIPAGGAIALQLLGGILAEGGVLYYLLVFYPVTLAAEAWLSLPLHDGPGQSPPSGGVPPARPRQPESSSR
jgi:hypothetical protein